MRQITMTWEEARWEPGVAEELIALIEACLDGEKRTLPDRIEVTTDALTVREGAE